MKLSPFKIGLGLVILGMIWISFVYAETEKTHEETTLKQSSSFELKQNFVGSDIGFYKIYMPEFEGDELFIQILDIRDNVIEEQKIQTKMSVGYFDFNEDGVYTLKITNISKDQVSLQIEFGNTNSQQMIPAGIMILVGALVMIVMGYLKIKNYNMAQPDEKIS